MCMCVCACACVYVCSGGNLGVTLLFKKSVTASGDPLLEFMRVLWIKRLDHKEILQDKRTYYVMLMGGGGGGGGEGEKECDAL